MQIEPAFVTKLLAEDVEPHLALGQLSSFWSVRASMGSDGDITGLSPPERAVHLWLLYSGNVGNGGHSQYFLNPISSLAQETVSALLEIGLDKHAAVLRKAISILPGSSVPKDHSLRRQAISELGATGDAALGQADAEFETLRAMAPDIRALRYLVENRDQVLTPEQR